MDTRPLPLDDAALDDAAPDALCGPAFQEDEEESESWRREALARFYIATFPAESPLRMLQKYACCLVWLNVAPRPFPLSFRIGFAPPSRANPAITYRTMPLWRKRWIKPRWKRRWG
ncbi:MAG: hypothetical protein IT210_00180 [Armatimonadetes bacterium]|nr:hypothetical protein [Armatimonadota bacterium]